MKIVGALEALYSVCSIIARRCAKPAFSLLQILLMRNNLPINNETGKNHLSVSKELISVMHSR